MRGDHGELGSELQGPSATVGRFADFLSAAHLVTAMDGELATVWETLTFALLLQDGGLWVSVGAVSWL